MTLGGITLGGKILGLGGIIGLIGLFTTGIFGCTAIGL